MAKPFQRPALGVTRKRGRSSVVFSVRTDSPDASGQVVATWATHGTPRRSNLMPIDSHVTEDGAGRVTLATHMLSIRYLSGLTDSMRATVDGELYEIFSVIDPDNLRREQFVEVRRIE